MTWLLCAVLAASNTVTVVGRRAESEREDRPGKSLVIRPEDPSRFDTKAQLAREASLALPETGRVTAQGFAVPRVRGQDTRLTEVYVDDLLLQDPYSGLPLIDELDLRAFGELAVYQGVSPVTLPTLNSIGVVQYRIRPSAKPALGLTAGKPYGISTWTLAKGGDLRAYARRHVTDGRYDYYSDNGTPYNTSDDGHATRENNHRSSTQFMVYDHTKISDEARVKVLALSQESRTGLPALNVNLSSLAEQKAASRLANLHFERDVGARTFVLKASGHEDERQTSDPTHGVFSAQEGNGFRSSAGSLGLAVDWNPEIAVTRLSVDHEESRARVLADDETRVKVRRATDKLALGAAVDVTESVKIESKGLVLALDDRFEDDRRRTTTNGASLAVEFRTVAFSVYAQAGLNRRAPSLLEEFGDGGTVLPAGELTAERGEHLEAGVSTRGLGLSVFQDETKDRITLAPALAGAIRAQNVGKTRVRGIEANAELALDSTRLFATYTFLRPFDLTNEASPRMLPFVAERQATAGVEQKVSRVTLREASRYQGEVYRDLSNSIVVPAYVVHDLSVDAAFPAGETREFAAGIALLNATNVQKLAIRSPGTEANDGATSYSDVTGYALPGRQWRLTVSVTF